MLTPEEISVPNVRMKRDTADVIVYGPASSFNPTSWSCGW